MRFIITKSKIIFLKKKKIVVIGDLSLSPSYGGVLTSYGLFNFLRKLKNYKKYIIETIPFYSFSLNSPLYGFDNLSYIERFFFKKNIYPFNFKKNISYLPDNFYEFSKVYKKILQKKIFIDELIKIKSADLILINAEGALVENYENPRSIKKSTLYYLFLLYLLKKFNKIKANKDIIILNHCFFPPKKLEDKFISYYSILNKIIVRDKMSLNKINNKDFKLKPIFFPDFIFHNKQIVNYSNHFKYKKFCEKHKNNYIILSDSAHMNRPNVKLNYRKFYTNLLKILKKKNIKVIFLNGNNPTMQNYISELTHANNIIEIRMDNTLPEDLIFLIKNCKFMISGRWHFSLLSFRFCKPLILFDTDSPKTKALSKEIYNNNKFYLTSKDFNSSKENLQKKINIFLQSSKVIKRLFKLKNTNLDKKLKEQEVFFNKLIL
jgi:polysaccharide pyruvyl transferase WcaK-like protein